MTAARSIFKLNYLPLWEREVKVWGNRVTATSLDRLLNLYLYHLGIRGGGEKRFFAQYVRPGMNVLDRVVELCNDIATVEATPNMEGRRMIMVIAPKPGVVRKAQELKKAQATQQLAAMAAAKNTSGKPAPQQAPPPDDDDDDDLDEDAINADVGDDDDDDDAEGQPEAAE